MAYKLTITESSDTFLDHVFHGSMKDLGKFYEIQWTANIPKIVLLKDRKSIDFLRAKKTEPWLVAWADERMRIVFALDRKALKKHSSHVYSDTYYTALIKHELSHLFYKILSAGKQGPSWLSEGLAIYTSGQNKLKTKPDEFKTFLSFYGQGGFEVYAESGFVVELLVKKFGKDKLLELIKALQNVHNEKQFSKIFKKNYGFAISYKNVNRLWKESFSKK